MHGNNISINRTPRLEELANLLKHLITTLSRYQTDGLEDQKITSRLPFYALLHLKIMIVNASIILTIMIVNASII